MNIPYDAPLNVCMAVLHCVLNLPGDLEYRNEAKVNLVPINRSLTFCSFNCAISPYNHPPFASPLALPPRLTRSIFDSLSCAAQPFHLQVTRAQFFFAVHAADRSQYGYC
jgi:hypothetical protein